MQNTADHQRAAKRMNRPCRGRRQFEHKQDDQPQRRVLGEVSVHADRLQQLRLAAVAEPDAVFAAHTRGIGGERKGEQRQRPGIEGGDGRRRRQA